MILAIHGSTPAIRFLALALIALLLVAWAIRRAWRQPSAERILAYTALGHVGFFLLSVASIGPAAMTAMLYYFIAYIFMLTGAFVLLTALRRQDALPDAPPALHCLFPRTPLLSFPFTLFMLSLPAFPSPPVVRPPRRRAARPLPVGSHPPAQRFARLGAERPALNGQRLTHRR